MGNMMSLNISDDVIKAAVQEEVHAGIVKALGDPSVIVRDAIKAMTDKYVDEKGNFCRKDSWRARPYFDFLAEDVVKTTVKEEIEKYVNENREEFAEEIRKQLKSTDFKKNIAASFLQAVVKSTESDWKMPISISFEKPKEDIF
nr:MAG TPA: hypothetical protein [Caudoviricetes sp.]